MNKIFFVLFILLSNTWAKSETVVIENAQISASVPEGWETISDLLGLPWVILSPQQADKNRAVITITQASKGKEDLRLGDSFIKQASEEFKSNKTDWLKKNRGSLIEFLPQEVLSWSPDHKTLALGYIYDLKGKRNTEMSYYIECGSRLYFAKILVNEKNLALLAPSIKTLESLKCP